MNEQRRMVEKRWALVEKNKRIKCLFVGSSSKESFGLREPEKELYSSYKSREK